MILLVCLAFCENLSAQVYVGESCQNTTKKKIKVGLIVDEFFGGAGTAYGGYGFLARNAIAKHIPDEDIEIDVLLGRSRSSQHIPKKYLEDNVTLYELPKIESFAREFLKEQNYDVYLSIELVSDYVIRLETESNKKLILWIQDPRPKSTWKYINTMQSIKDPCFYKQRIYNVVNKWAGDGRVTFISQGYSLNPLALELYKLPLDTPIRYIPNPVDIDFNFQFNVSVKKKQVVFLARLAAQKRPWLFCEVAKRMPEYQFLVLGKIVLHRDDNEKMMSPYMKGDIPNLHFMGHVDGEEKMNIIKESRMLLSTAIHEGIPISWLEALCYGTVVVSNLEREGLVERFGGKAPDLLGDGFDGIDTFLPVIRKLMEDDEEYSAKANSAIEYIRKVHNVSRFTEELRNVIRVAVRNKIER